MIAPGSGAGLFATKVSISTSLCGYRLLLKELKKFPIQNDANVHEMFVIVSNLQC